MAETRARKIILPVRPRRGRRPIEHINKFIKYALFSFNFIFWVCGIALAAVTFYLLESKQKILRDITDFLFDPVILLCIVGCIMFTIAFFGCLGALRENIYLLKTFHISLTILLILQLLLGVMLFVFYYIPEVRNFINWFPEDNLKEAIVRYRDDLDLRDLIDSLQKLFSCCGLSSEGEGYKDWQLNMYFNCSSDNPSVERCGVPYSCCRLKQDEMINTMCGYGVTSKKKIEVEHIIYTEGCIRAFGSWLEKNSVVIGAISLGVIIPQLVIMFLTWTLIDQIRRQLSQWKKKSRSSNSLSKC